MPYGLNYYSNPWTDAAGGAVAAGQGVSSLFSNLASMGIEQRRWEQQALLDRMRLRLLAQQQAEQQRQFGVTSGFEQSRLGLAQDQLGLATRAQEESEKTGAVTRSKVQQDVSQQELYNRLAEQVGGAVQRAGMGRMGYDLPPDVAHERWAQIEALRDLYRIAATQPQTAAQLLTPRALGPGYTEHDMFGNMIAENPRVPQEWAATFPSSVLTAWGQGALSPEQEQKAAAMLDQFYQSRGIEAPRIAPTNAMPSVAVAPRTPKITTKEEYDALPSGSKYIGKDDRTYQKP